MQVVGAQNPSIFRARKQNRIWIEEHTFKCANLQNWILMICAYQHTFVNSCPILFASSECARVLRPYTTKYSHYLLGSIELTTIIMCKNSLLATATFQKRAWSDHPKLSSHISLVSAPICFILGAFLFPNRGQGYDSIFQGKIEPAHARCTS